MATTRRALPDDAEHVWPLVRDFATSYAPDRETFEQSFRTVLGSPDSLAVVATSPEPGSQVVGYLLASKHPTFFGNAPVCWVGEVMVDADYRGSGVGRALMRGAEEWATENGCAYVSLASRRAGGFYTELGYEDSAVFYKRETARQP